jgi:hypothetical protein
MGTASSDPSTEPNGNRTYPHLPDARAKLDQVLIDIADYVTRYRIESAEAYDLMPGRRGGAVVSHSSFLPPIPITCGSGRAVRFRHGRRPPAHGQTSRVRGRMPSFSQNRGRGQVFGVLRHLKCKPRARSKGSVNGTESLGPVIGRACDE